MKGVGVDAVDVDRFRGMLERRDGLAERLFSDAERAYADRAADPAERLAVRFAAKEAVWKALGVGIGAFGFRDVEVTRPDDGPPEVVLHAAAAEMAAERGVERWHLSLTHTATTAVAVAIAT